MASVGLQSVSFPGLAAIIVTICCACSAADTMVIAAVWTDRILFIFCPSSLVSANIGLFYNDTCCLLEIFGVSFITTPHHSFPDHLVGPVINASTARAEDLGIESRLHWDFSGSSHTSDIKNGTLVAIPCQAPGVIGSALGLVGPVSVYCDRVRWKV